MQTSLAPLHANQKNTNSFPILAIALIGLTYLAVLFNFTSLCHSTNQTVLGVAQWESQPTARVTRDGSRRTVSVRVWKRSGDVRHLLVAGRRDASNSLSVSRISTPERNTPTVSLGFPREARITRGVELQRIAREGKRIRTKHLEVRAAASPLAHVDHAFVRCRIGLVVPRFRHSAVSRNKVKRRLRELARTYLMPTGISVDIVLRIRPEAYDASFENLAKEIQSTLEQLRGWFGDASGTDA
jgi:ribonuclease P protein component